jgi:integrase/recombinase XerC
MTRTELARLREPLPEVPALGPADVLTAFLAGRNPRTLLAYDRDLEDFAYYVREADGKAALALLLDLPHGTANRVALGYKASMIDRGLKSATVARRLAALRSVVKMARMIGVVPWTLDVENPKAQPYRDTKGPGPGGWRAMRETARSDCNRGSKAERKKAMRDLTILRLLHDLALRRGEVVALDLADVDLASSRVAVLGKGRTEKDRLTLPDETRDVLAAWIARRGPEPGALFVRLDRGRKGLERLTASGLYKIVRELGEKAGLLTPVRPHGLRHEAITRALDEMHGDVRTVRRFSRHASAETVLIYDDQRQDVAGDVARKVARDD